MENGFSLNTRLTCLSYPRYHVFRATRITADFTVGSSDMSTTRWKKKTKRRLLRRTVSVTLTPETQRASN